MTIIDRITEFRKYIGIGQTAFESSIGVSRGYLSNIKSIGSDKLLNISAVYPQLNIDWLISGKGEMIKQREHELYIGDNNHQINIGSNIKNKSIAKAKELKEIELLKLQYASLEKENQHLKEKIELLEKLVAALSK